MQYRQLIEIVDKGFRTLFLLEFQHEQDVDWYEVRIYRGQELVGYLHGDDDTERPDLSTLIVQNDVQVIGGLVELTALF